MASKTIDYSLFSAVPVYFIGHLFFFFAIYTDPRRIVCIVVQFCHLIESAFRRFLPANALRNATRLHGMFCVVQIASRLDSLRRGTLLRSRHKFVIVGYALHMYTRPPCQARAVTKTECAKKLQMP